MAVNPSDKNFGATIEHRYANKTNFTQYRSANAGEIIKLFDDDGTVTSSFLATPVAHPIPQEFNTLWLTKVAGVSSMSRDANQSARFCPGNKGNDDPPSTFSGAKKTFTITFRTQCGSTMVWRIPTSQAILDAKEVADPLWEYKLALQLFARVTMRERFSATEAELNAYPRHISFLGVEYELDDLNTPLGQTFTRIGVPYP